MNELTYDSSELTNDFCNKNKRFYHKIENDKIILKNKRGRSCTFRFPNKINIKPSTIGLIDGEGYIRNTFVFANSDELIIKNILEFLSQFDIKVKTYLEICTKNTDNEFITKSKNAWSKLIKIDKIRLRKEFNNTTDKGTLHIIYSNKIFCYILKSILDISRYAIKNNKELAIDYMKGIIAAEGNINIKKDTKCVYMVRISAKEERVREFYKELLEKIGINVTCKDMKTISKEECKKLGWKTDKGRAGCVIISRWDNFLKIFMLNLLELNKRKQKVFSKYFINNKFTKQLLDFDYFINKEFMMKEAQKVFKLKSRKTNRIKTLERLNLVNKSFIKNVGNNKVYSYILNDNYLKIYEKLNRSHITPFV